MAFRRRRISIIGAEEADSDTTVAAIAAEAERLRGDGIELLRRASPT